MKRSTWIPVLAVLSLACAPRPLAAQQQQSQEGAPGAAKSVLDGVYTEAQASSGKAAFTEICSACHSSSQFSGLVKLWAGRTVYDLFEQIRTTMPYDGPGRLSREEYAAIIAYLINLNGYPAGTSALANDPALLKQIKIVKN
jgi:mono/diheme cytochrome c family protein